MVGESTAGAASGRARTRQRTYKKAPPLNVPDIEDDAAERKRILNVLAQRRYRERKRQTRLKTHGVELEGDGTAVTEDWGLENPMAASDDSGDASSSGWGLTPPDSVSPARQSVAIADQPAASPDIMSGLSLDPASWDALGDVSLGSLPVDLSTLPELSSEEEAALEQVVNASPSTCLPQSSSITTTLSFTPAAVAAFSAATAVNFLDGINLPILELTLSRAAVRISERLGCAKGSIWSLEGASPFTTGIATPSDQLPAPWRPTALQLAVPHHPVADFLPWPAVRDRFLSCLTMPDEFRPPILQGPLGFCNLAYDIEDASEGLRIYGDDPYDPAQWEVGQLMFERWWFLLDREIINTSNRLRRLRGAPPLMPKATGSTSPSSAS